MMTSWIRAIGIVGLVATVWGGSPAWAETLREGGVRCTPTSPERPYVCDVGAPKPISTRTFRDILGKNKAIRDTVARIGFPDYAEMQRVDVESPWASFEIRTYYREYKRMFAYGRAFLLDRPTVALMRYQGPLPKGFFDAAPIPASALSTPEQDALRAERAAAEAEQDADRADRDADRAEAIASTAALDFREGLIKR